MSDVRLAMRCLLPMVAPAPLPTGVEARGLAASDVDELGQLMYDAYRHGVEDTGQSPGYHHDEAVKVLTGGYGDMIWDASLWATLNGRPGGATVVVDWTEQGETLLAFALVGPAARGLGLGGSLIARSGELLAAGGHADWALAVVPDNPAKRLYERLGFREFDPHADEPTG
jgi:GNAT superfamily N-acetyltransferase